LKAGIYSDGTLHTSSGPRQLKGNLTQQLCPDQIGIKRRKRDELASRQVSPHSRKDQLFESRHLQCRHSPHQQWTTSAERQLNLAHCVQIRLASKDENATNWHLDRFLLTLAKISFLKAGIYSNCTLHTSGGPRQLEGNRVSVGRVNLNHQVIESSLARIVPASPFPYISPPICSTNELEMDLLTPVLFCRTQSHP
jgi:hypothetical protein